MGKSKRDKIDKKDDSQEKLIARAKDLHHNWEVIESHEAGLALVGTEVKALRTTRANLKDSYCKFEGNELYIIGMYIAPYSHGTYANHSPERKRKLLLHRRELERLNSKVKEKGLSIVPAKIYFTRGMAKIEIALARGKKTHDRREELRRKTIDREMERAMRRGK